MPLTAPARPAEIRTAPSDRSDRAAGAGGVPVLYISYDGMLEPLGESQVLGYVEPLAATRPLHLISFEKAEDRRDAGRMSAMRERLERSGIRWTPLPYHKSPTAPATSWDIARGIAAGLAIVRRHRAGILHARSYVAALMALAIKRATEARLLFDMRGFWADERVDGGLWPRDGHLFRTAKALERRLLLGADHVVTLTEASAREIERFDYLANRTPPLTVIPTCADLDRFRPLPADPDRPFTLGYVGSVGTWYLFEETLALFGTIRRARPEARLLVVNRSEHARIRKAAEAAGLEPDILELAAAPHREVPHLIARMHAATALYRPTYSKVATAPTKVAEYLGCGIPCASNAGVGDMEDVLEGNRVGVVLRDFSRAEMERCAERLLALVADARTPGRCVATAARLFSVTDGVAAYEDIYRTLSPAAAR